MIETTDNKLVGGGQLLSRQVIDTYDNRTRAPAVRGNVGRGGRCQARAEATIILPLQGDREKARQGAQRYADLRKSLTRDPSNLPRRFSVDKTQTYNLTHRATLDAAIERRTEAVVKEFLHHIAHDASQRYADEIARLDVAWVALQMAARVQRGACLAENRTYSMLLDAAPTGQDLLDLLNDPAPLAKLQRLIADLSMEASDRLEVESPYVRFADLPVDEVQKRALAEHGQHFTTAARPEAWAGCAPGLSSAHEGLAWLDGLATMRQIVLNER
jgi:hypothetical protein